MNFFHCDKTPNPISQAEIQKRIRDNIKVPEQLSQQLELQEQENKKDKQPPTLCPYTFETLWGVIENNPEGNLSLENLDDNLKDKIHPLMNEALLKLYEVFFQYTLLYLQQTDKKDEISITFQDIMHFLKFVKATLSYHFAFSTSCFKTASLSSSSSNSTTLKAKEQMTSKPRSTSITASNSPNSLSSSSSSLSSTKPST
jgi:hypothetical protein